MSNLNIQNLSMVFGGIVAISNASFKIKEGTLAGLIGPNGAGKTTLFNCLTGVYSPSSGVINLEKGEDVIRLNQKKPNQITQLGLARTFQNIRLFDNLTVIDNVKVAMNRRLNYGLMTSILRLPKFYLEEEKAERYALDLLRRVNLEGEAYNLARNLPYGKQRRLEIVRALATGADFLFLDEPAAGMNPQETDDLLLFIRQIHKDFNLTILLIEHDMSLVMSLCERIYVLDYGRMIAEGTPAEIKANPQVIKAYLGEETDA